MCAIFIQYLKCFFNNYRSYSFIQKSLIRECYMYESVICNLSGVLVVSIVCTCNCICKYMINELLPGAPLIMYSFDYRTPDAAHTVSVIVS